MSFSSTSSSPTLDNPANTLGYLSPRSESHTSSRIFSVEGNIGSGKSTLLRLIKEKIDFAQVVREPVVNWQAINGNPELNLLDAFY
jgi:tRNA A37 threonylcarbamoyladenosine biosynthesis protein TsaE